MVKNDPKMHQKDPKIHKNGQKHKKLFFSAPERARTVLNAFLECMYFEFGLDGRRPYKRPNHKNINIFPLTVTLITLVTVITLVTLTLT